MERGSIEKPVQVRNYQRGFSVAGVLLITAIAILVVVILILYLRNRQTTTPDNSQNNKQCITNFDCSGGLICDQSNNTCVECATNDDCSFATPLCDPATKTCKECLTDANCPADKPSCNPELNTCFQCESNADCNGSKPICNPASKQCVECAVNNDCSGDTPLCENIGSFRCVECLNNGDCAVGTCAGGKCCDFEAPSISSVELIPQPQTRPFLPPAFTINYITSQPSSIITGVILQIKNLAGVTIITTGVLPHTGSIDFISPIQALISRLFFDFTYEFSVRLITTCGPTAFSEPVNKLYPLPDDITPLLVTNTQGNLTGVTFQIPDTYDIAFGCSVSLELELYVYSQANFEPNSGVSTVNSFSTGCQMPGDPDIPCPNNGCKFAADWPVSVVAGQTVYIIVTRTGALTDKCVASMAVPVLIVP